MQGNGRLATDLQGCIRTSNGDPRTETFSQMRVTMGHTACSVKGVPRAVGLLFSPMVSG